MTTHDQVRKFIVAELNFPGAESELTDDYPLLAKEVLDSMGIVQVVDYLEATFGIEVDDEDLVPDHFSTIDGIAGLVATKQAA